MQLEQSQEIVEVFGVWDCYEQQWRDDLPKIIRYDDRDMLVDASGEAISDRIEAVDDHDDSLLYELCGIPKEKSRDMCLCWLAEAGAKAELKRTVF